MKPFPSTRGAARLLLMVAAPLTAATLEAQSAFVRVNQVGYMRHAPKRAYLLATDIEQRVRFQVKSSGGRTVFSGTVPAARDRGPWGDFAHVVPLDFDGVTDDGTFTIEVAGPTPASSPAFRIAGRGRLYRTPLANALSFYQVQRDGPNFIRGPLRDAPAHLNDRRAKVYRTPVVDEDGNFEGDLTPTGATIDASGGWADAGDYLKFVQTHSYTVGMMLTGMRDFPAEMGSAADSSNFASEAKFGLDWLQKMWDDDREILYYQVGIGGSNEEIASDHDLWRLPQDDDDFEPGDATFRYIRHRPVFINPAGGAGARVSPNLAGRLAADFALCFQLFRKSRPDYANRCLAAAEHVFDRADTSPDGELLTAIPFGFYPEDEWRDDLEWGATELFLALSSVDRDDLSRDLPHRDPHFYLRKAAHWARALLDVEGGGILSVSDVSALAHFQLVRALREAGHVSGLEVKKADLIDNLKSVLDDAASHAGRDPFAFGVPWGEFDTATNGAALSVMASQYDFLTDSRTFERFAHGWLGNILGANAWGISLIVGDGTRFPQCMQHQIANLAGSLDGSRPVLKGALVEGPNSFAADGALDEMRTCPADGVDVFAPFNGNDAVFKDHVESWSTVEPALDLTVSSPMAFAWLTARSPAALRLY
jgi:endoglucanase